ncbi:BF3164 family lipoprotein [uncultured Roseivirga sp.]|uniref:BF3164 family lipoprotein n=1 Tax=uncultured Roseivirga sp. TaxID=543088 RepID=UPI002584616C|nr:BF3164 family lipoprotein [uncultured Roseivirga sp.]|tara:strand:+ start:2673 stop:3752 length:1080 start_codon:yes stop_codon:yes gene_type:complete
MRLRFSLILVTYTLITSCTSNDSKNPFDFASKEHLVYSLKGKKYTFDVILSPYKIERKNEFLILVENRKVSTEQPLIHILRCGNLEYVASKGVNGLGPYEITDADVFDHGFNDSTFWVNSTMSKKMAEFSLYDLSKLAIREIRLPENMATAFKSHFASDSTFISLATNDSARLIEYNRNGEKIAGYGRWKKVPNQPDLSNYMLQNIYGGWFKKDPYDSLILKALAYVDRIEIFDLRTKSFTIINGPRKEIPPFQILGTGASAIAAYSRDIKFGHRDITAGKKYLYDLYGGFSEEEYLQTSKLAETIYVISKKGDVKAKLNLDRSLRTIAVNEELGKLYGITTDENPGIAVFDIPRELLQ